MTTGGDSSKRERRHTSKPASRQTKGRARLQSEVAGSNPVAAHPANGVCPATSKPCERSYMAGGCTPSCCLTLWYAERVCGFEAEKNAAPHDNQADRNSSGSQPPEVPADAAAELVAQQANDAGLWFVAQTASEAYLQRALRELHAAIEGSSGSQMTTVRIVTGRLIEPDGKEDVCDQPYVAAQDALELERELAAERDRRVNAELDRDVHKAALSATRATVIEECAKVCDYRASKKGKDDEAEDEARVCAAMIRALDSGAKT